MTWDNMENCWGHRISASLQLREDDIISWPQNGPWAGCHHLCSLPGSPEKAHCGPLFTFGQAFFLWSDWYFQGMSSKCYIMTYSKCYKWLNLSQGLPPCSDPSPIIAAISLQAIGGWPSVRVYYWDYYYHWSAPLELSLCMDTAGSPNCSYMIILPQARMDKKNTKWTGSLGDRVY